MYKLDDIIQLEEEIFNSITAQDWDSYYKHVVYQEEEYLATEVATDTQTDSSSSDSDISLEDELLGVQPLL
jgi:hypothetical protein